jgi:hypothetical protein
MDAPEIKFSLNLSMLIECIHLYSSVLETTSLSFFYSVIFTSKRYLFYVSITIIIFLSKTLDGILKVSLEDSGVLTVCDINSLFICDHDDEVT